MIFYAAVGTLTNLIDQLDGDKHQKMSEMHLEGADTEAQRENGKRTIQFDLPRLPFFGTNDQWQQFVTTYSDPSSPTDLIHYVQGNMDARGIVLILSTPPIYTPFMPEELDPSDDQFVDFMTTKTTVSCELAYVDDQNRCCGLTITYDKPADPKRWIIALVKNTNLNPDQRDVFVLSTEKIACLKADANTNHVFEINSADTPEYSRQKYRLLWNIDNQTLRTFVKFILHKDGLIDPYSKILSLFLSHGTTQFESQSTDLKCPNLFKLLPSTHQECERLLNDKVLQRLSDYSIDVHLSHQQLQSIMTQKGPLYTVLSILFENCAEDTKSALVNKLTQTFNSPLFQPGFDSTSELDLFFNKTMSSYPLMSSTNPISELETFFKTEKYLASIEVTPQYIYQFGLATCELINRLIDSNDTEKIQNLPIVINNFLSIFTNNKTPSQEFINHQLDIFWIALTLNELGMDPAAAYKMDQKYHLSILDECGIDPSEVNANTLTQSKLYQRFLKALQDYLDKIGVDANSAQSKKLIHFVLSKNLFAQVVGNEKPLPADENEALLRDLQLELKHFSQNCFSAVFYEDLLNLTRGTEPHQYLTTATLINFGKVLNSLDKKIERSYKNNDGILIPAPLVHHFFDAFLSLDQKETKLNESHLLQVIEAYNHTFNNQAAVALESTLLRLLLTNPALCTLLLLLKEDQMRLSKEKTLLANEIMSLHHFSRLTTLLPILLPQDLAEDTIKRLEQVLANTIAALVKDPIQVDFDKLLIKEFAKEKLESLGEQLQSYLLYIAALATSEADFEQKNAMIVQLTSNDIKGKQFFNAMYTTRAYLDDIETRLRTETSTKTEPNQPDVMRAFENARKDSETKLLVRIYDILQATTKPTKKSIKASMMPLLKPIIDAVPKENHPWIKTSLTILVNSLSIILTLGIVNLGHKLKSGHFLLFSHPNPKKQIDAATDDLTEAINKRSPL